MRVQSTVLAWKSIFMNEFKDFIVSTVRKQKRSTPFSMVMMMSKNEVCKVKHVQEWEKREETKKKNCKKIEKR